MICAGVCPPGMPAICACAHAHDCARSGSSSARSRRRADLEHRQRAVRLPIEPHAVAAAHDDEHEPRTQPLALRRRGREQPRQLRARELDRRHVAGLEARRAGPRLRARDLAALEAGDVARTVEANGSSAHRRHPRRGGSIGSDDAGGERRSGIVLRADAAREAALCPWEEREAGAALVAHDSPRIAKAPARNSIGSAVSACENVVRQSRRLRLGKRDARRRSRSAARRRARRSRPCRVRASPCQSSRRRASTRTMATTASARRSRARNWAGAKRSSSRRRRRRSLPPTAAPVTRNSRAPVGTFSPNRSSVRSNGATRCRTCSVPSGCASTSVVVDRAQRDERVAAVPAAARSTSAGRRAPPASAARRRFPRAAPPARVRRSSRRSGR